VSSHKSSLQHLRGYISMQVWICYGKAFAWPYFHASVDILW